MPPRKKKAAPVKETVPEGVYRIDFNAAHTEYRNAAGDVLNSVTTILKIINKPALIGWAYKMGKEGKNMRRVVDEAADVGTIAHAMCECHLKGLKLDHSNLAPTDVDRAENSYLKFLSWWEKNRFTLEESEFKMVDEVWQVGGTADVIAIDSRGRRCLIDLKTSKGIYTEMKLQVAAYAAMYERLRLCKVDIVYICRIGKEDEGDFDIYQMPDNDRQLALAAFEAAVPLYHYHEALEANS